MRRYIGLMALGLLAACGAGEAAQTGAPETATAKLMRGDAEVGHISLMQQGEHVAMSLKVEGLETGPYGIHLHETGKCDGPDYKSAGGHWNPAGKEHGRENPKGSHAGDLPNLSATVGQATRLERSLTGLALTGENGLMDADGAALVIHAKADDLKSDPSGNSGARIICGVFAMETAE